MKNFSFISYLEVSEKFVVGLLGGGFQVTNPNPSFLELRLVQLSRVRAVV